jgi:hypothetical protein
MLIELTYPAGTKQCYKTYALAVRVAAIHGYTITADTIYRLTRGSTKRSRDGITARWVDPVHARLASERPTNKSNVSGAKYVTDLPKAHQQSDLLVRNEFVRVIDTGEIVMVSAAVVSPVDKQILYYVVHPFTHDDGDIDDTYYGVKYKPTELTPISAVEGLQVVAAAVAHVERCRNTGASRP